jgi:hypothetical protein
MGWQSSLLGSNVVSSYEHIDNLRNDLAAGKFWDSGETKYTRIQHDGTNGIIDSSSGNLLLKCGGNTILTLLPNTVLCEKDFAVYNGKYNIAYAVGNSTYTFMAHTGTKGIFSATSGNVQLSGTANNYVYIGAGSGQSRIYMYDAGLGAWRYIYVNNGSVAVGT